MNSRLPLVLILAITIVCCLASSCVAKSVAAGEFALNGRTTAGSGSSQIDWDTIYSGNFTPHTSVFVQDYFTASSGSPQRDPSSWFQGHSKDTYDIPEWKWTPNLNTNDKGNILNAYAAVISSNDTSGRVSIYFGLDREAQNGQAYAFNGVHKDGDLLVVADFPGQGSSTPASIQVLMWRAGNVSSIFYTNTNAKCNASDASQVVCAITNDYENVSSPWYYDGKFAQGYSIPARNFFEGGLLVTGLSNLTGLAHTPCYSSYLATTRVSNQINAESMDFAYGALKQCGLSIDANCLGGRQRVLDLNATYTIPPFEWNYTVSVTNLGYNDVNNVKITLNNDLLFDLGTMKGDETFTGNGTMTTNDTNVIMGFQVTGSANFAYVAADGYNPCTSPVPDDGLTPGEKAAIAVGSIVGGAVVAGLVAGLVLAGYVVLKQMNAAAPPQELTSDMTNLGDNDAGVNGLFEDNVTEGTNPMFTSTTV